MNKAAIYYIIAIVIILLIVAYYYMSSTSSSAASSSGSSYVAPSSGSSSSGSSYVAPSTQTVNTAAAPSAKQTGIYYYTPSPPNVTYAQAQSIASSLGVAIASPAQLVAGGTQGINLCSYGWLNNGKPGLFMQAATVNCGPQGLSYNNSTVAYGIWVYGVIPASVLASGSPTFAIV